MFFVFFKIVLIFLLTRLYYKQGKGEKVKDRKKIIKILSFVFLGIIAIAGIISAFVLNYNVFAPTAPYVIDDGSNIFFATKINENYHGYRFKISASGEEDRYIESKVNTISSQQMELQGMAVGKEYDVSVCYLGETEGSNSPYSPTSKLKLQQYIERPELTIGAGQYIQWQPVDKAQKYYVYIKDGGAYSFVMTYETSFNFANLAGGEKEFYVIAESSKVGYKNSPQSTVLKVDHIYHMRPLSNLQLNNQSLILSFKAEEKISYAKLYIGEKDYIVKLSSPTVAGGKFSYSFNIASTNYKEGMIVGVAPYSEDPLSVYAGDILYL